MPTVSGQCAAKGCIREAYVRVKHPTFHCDWQLVVCAKHEQAARDRLEAHMQECTEGKGTKYCAICDEEIDGFVDLYQRKPGSPKEWIHVRCLTDDGTDDTLAAAKQTTQKGRGMKDPVTGKKAAKNVEPEEDDLPPDFEEVEPSGSAQEQMDEEDDEEEDEKPAKVSKKASKPAKAAKPAAKSAKAEKPAADKSAKIAAKAKQVTSKGDTFTSKVEREPDGDTTVTRLIRGKEGEISIRLNSHVIAQWLAAEKNKAVQALLNRGRYAFTIKSDEEADQLVASAEKIAEGKITKKSFAGALTKATENIERWRKEIKKF